MSLFWGTLQNGPAVHLLPLETYSKGTLKKDRPVWDPKETSPMLVPG